VIRFGKFGCGKLCSDASTELSRVAGRELVLDLSLNGDVICELRLEFLELARDCYLEVRLELCFENVFICDKSE